MRRRLGDPPAAHAPGLLDPDDLQAELDGGVTGREQVGRADPATGSVPQHEPRRALPVDVQPGLPARRVDGHDARGPGSGSGLGGRHCG